MESVEVPVRTSGKRASARNPYVACLGCSEFIEVASESKNPVNGREVGEVEVLDTKDHWHTECFNYYCEKELEDATEGKKGAAVDEAVKGVLEKEVDTH